jgi:hypothetical protein
MLGNSQTVSPQLPAKKVAVVATTPKPARKKRETVVNNSVNGSKSIDERLLALEAVCMNPRISGTTLERYLDSKAGLQWSLAIGALSLPKVFFTGPTVESVISAAEKKLIKKE